MSVSYGLGMLLVGVICITIGATATYIIFNKIEKERKNEK
jgi:hypothetical protein|tara:strand:- start:689 stop:808 length:120 start_codon:yes stop_codon:yes gene_type:complete